MASPKTSRLGNIPNEGIKSPVINNTGVNIILSGEQLVNGVNAVSGQRWLVDSQTIGAENGIYIVSLNAWTRASDWNRSNDVVNGQIVTNETDGNIYQVSFSGNFILDVTSPTFGITAVGDFTDYYDKTEIDNSEYDQKLSISANDTTPARLNDKVTVGSGLRKTISNPTGNEELDIETTWRPYLTLAAMVADVDNIEIGDALILKERTTGNGGGATWYAIDATTAPGNAPNGFDIVAGNTEISFQLRNSIIPFAHEAAIIEQYGAIADAGITDSTGPIQAAFDSGYNVYVGEVQDPSTDYFKVTSAITFSANGQEFIGSGVNTIIQQVTANENVISATNFNDIKCANVRLYAVGSLSSIDNGQGIHLSNCDNSVVSSVVVENSRGNGIGLKNCNDCVVKYNTIRNSPVLDTDTHDKTQADIAVYWSSSRNIIKGNHCISGNGIGISIQSIIDADECNENVVTENVIAGMRVYGVNVYRNTAAGFVYRNQINNNNIRNISGAVAHSIDGNVFGAGIYIQGAEYSQCHNNTIDTTNTGTLVDQLAPGAIGAANVTNVSIVGNIITNPSWHGITVRDPTNQGLSTGSCLIDDNSIYNSGKSSIQVKEREFVTVRGSEIETSAADGIEVINTVTQRDTIIVDGFSIKNITGTAISASFVDGLTIGNGQIDTCTVTGISIANANDVKVHDVLVKNCTVRGIQNQSTNTSVTINDNTVIDNGVGMLIQSEARLNNNSVSNNTTDWQGDYQLQRTLGTGAATYSVADAGTIIVPTDGTAIDNLTGGVDGQQLTLIMTGARTFNDTSGGAGQMLLSGNFAATTNDALKLEFAGSAWYEVSRSVN